MDEGQNCVTGGLGEKAEEYEEKRNEISRERSK
jgi:hypothetical protein